ncbi:DUF305 domain-containing protein [Streptomyces sp. NPDC005551]|uniref:DUF305 domain-containing protein n=1 Tax=Streptomyces sp. NPDC005551 TaxID=3364725 RepID=UPI0036BF8BB3
MTSFTRPPHREPLRRAAATGVTAAVVLFLSACGGNGDDTSGRDHGGHDSSASAAPGAGSFNDADVTFAQLMVPHHEQALQMAALAGARASDTQVKDIAAKIEKAQDAEIRTLKGWLKSWKAPTAMESMPGMDHHGGDGMMTGTDMKRLEDMKGAAFDKAFAEMMVDHHNGAIGMARDEQRHGENTGAVRMAGDIVEGQSAEVAQLKGILDRL